MKQLGKVAYISTYPPRRCEIAAFTNEVATAYAREFLHSHFRVLALTEGGNYYEYPDCVCHEIEEEDRNAYAVAARFLNDLRPKLDVVSLQHHYGIFGGEEGDYILALLETLQVPVVTTLHSIRMRPTAQTLQLTKKIASLSDRAVLRSQRDRKILEKIYGVESDRIDVIPPQGIARLGSGDVDWEGVARAYDRSFRLAIADPRSAKRADASMPWPWCREEVSSGGVDIVPGWEY